MCLKQVDISGYAARPCPAGKELCTCCVPGSTSRRRKSGFDRKYQLGEGAHSKEGGTGGHCGCRTTFCNMTDSVSFELRILSLTASPVLKPFLRRAHSSGGCRSRRHGHDVRRKAQWSIRKVCDHSSRGKARATQSLRIAASAITSQHKHALNQDGVKKRTI